MALRIAGLAKVSTDPEMIDVGDKYSILKCRMVSDRAGMIGKRNEGQTDDFPMEMFQNKEYTMVRLNKGDRIYVEGRLIMDQYKQDGQARKAYMVVADSIRLLSATPAAPARPEPTPAPVQEPDPMDSENIPF
jgi:single-stranded DNA-binding protein